MSYFRYSQHMGNMRMWCKERYPLPIKCIITFLRYIRMVSRSPDWIYNPHMVHMVLFLWKIANKFHAKYQLLGTLSIRETKCWAARRDIHCWLSVSKAFLDIYIWMIVRASGNIYKLLIVHTISFLSKTTKTFHEKYHIPGTLSEWKIWGCATRRDIHCCSTVW